MLAWRRHHPFAVLGVVVLIAPMLAACQAQPEPKPSIELPSRVVTVPVPPNLGQSLIDQARSGDGAGISWTNRREVSLEPGPKRALLAIVQPGRLDAVEGDLLDL